MLAAFGLLALTTACVTAPSRGRINKAYYECPGQQRGVLVRNAGKVTADLFLWRPGTKVSQFIGSVAPGKIVDFSIANATVVELYDRSVPREERGDLPDPATLHYEYYCRGGDSAS